jgi:hypothetical protein
MKKLITILMLLISTASFCQDEDCEDPGNGNGPGGNGNGNNGNGNGNGGGNVPIDGGVVLLIVGAVALSGYKYYQHKKQSA